MPFVAALIAAFFNTAAFAQTFSLPCRIFNDEPGFHEETNCAVRRERRIEISEAVIRKMSFSENGLAQTLLDHGWYYVKRDGTTLPVIRLGRVIRP